jgi:hypothetical protein
MHFTTEAREEGFFTTKEVTKEEIFTAEAQRTQSSERRGIFTTKITKGTKKEIIHRRGAEDTEFGEKRSLPRRSRRGRVFTAEAWRSQSSEYF